MVCFVLLDSDSGDLLLTIISCKTSDLRPAGLILRTRPKGPEAVNVKARPRSHVSPPVNQNGAWRNERRYGAKKESPAPPQRGRSSLLLRCRHICRSNPIQSGANVLFINRTHARTYACTDGCSADFRSRLGGRRRRSWLCSARNELQHSSRSRWFRANMSTKLRLSAS